MPRTRTELTSAQKLDRAMQNATETERFNAIVRFLAVKTLDYELETNGAVPSDLERRYAASIANYAERYNHAVLTAE